MSEDFSGYRFAKIIQGLRKPSEWLSLVQSVSITFIIHLAGFGLAYVVNVLMARWLGVDSYGNYVLVYNWGLLIALFGSVGFTSSILRFVPQYRLSGENQYLFGVIRFSSLLTLFSNILLVIIVSFVSTKIQPNGVNLDTIVLGLWVAPFLALQDLLSSILRGFDYIGLAFAPTRILRPILTIAFTFIAIHFMQGDRAQLALLALAASIIVILIIQSSVLSGTLKRRDNYTNVGIGYSVTYWLKISVPFLAIGASTMLLWRGTLIQTGIFLGAPAAALLFTADRLASLTSFILMASSSVFAPMITPLVDKDPEKLKRLTMTITRWTFWSSLIASIIIFIFADSLLSLFGSEYVDAKPVLFTFLIAQLVISITGPVGQLLNYSGYEIVNTRINMTTSFVALGANLIVIPLFKLEGAAAVILVTQCVKNIWTYIEVKRRLDIDSLTGIINIK